jgi:hypothetical protein
MKRREQIEPQAKRGSGCSLFFYVNAGSGKTDAKRFVLPFAQKSDRSRSGELRLLFTSFLKQFKLKV